MAEIWNLISRTNKYVDETAPWVLAKSNNNEDKEKLDSVMYHLAESLRKIAILLNPFITHTSNKIYNQLGIVDENLKTWTSLEKYDLINENTKVVEKGEPLFMRLDAETEIEYIKSQMK